MSDSQSFMVSTMFYPAEVISALCKLQAALGEKIYISGGTIRDHLLQRKPADLDITVAAGAEECCHRLIQILAGGTFVQLGTEEEEAARVVYKNFFIDFSSFRNGAKTIEEELHYRDFSVNAMAVSLDEAISDANPQLIDPLGGWKDCEKKVLRACFGAFTGDPLRMLRCFRFAAELEFTIEKQTFTDIQKHHGLINRVAAERIHYELQRIMSTPRGAASLQKMVDCSLLWQLFPEMEHGVGMEQPGYHHEDVFNHNLLALAWLERVIERPWEYFPSSVERIEEYLQAEERKRLLRWAAFFHDIGKPSTSSPGKGGYTTFYNHDRQGKRIFGEIGKRLRWSKNESDFVGKLIELHMHPFHLSNVRRESQLSRKALLNIYKKAGDDLPGLFLLAMADSLAGQGELKPDTMEEELDLLFNEVVQVVEEHIAPVRRGVRLVSGTDIINELHLSPGPVFRELLEEVEVAQVEGKISTKEEALFLLRSYLQEKRG